MDIATGFTDGDSPALAHPRKLIRRDLLDCEQRLRDSLFQVLPFESHAVYFPWDTGPEKPEWLPEEEKLLVPLRRDGELLGVFMVRRPDPTLVEALLPVLPGVAALCLDNLALYKSSRNDPLTALATGEALRERLLQEAELIRSSFARGPEAGEDERTHVGSMGLVALRFSGLRDIARDIGYAFADRLMAELARAFSAVLPEQALAARPGDCTLVVLLPEASRSQCEQMGEAALRAMSEVRLTDPLTGRRIGAQAYAGYALYPQDMDGTRLRDMDEHAHALLHKAELAADVARTRALRRTGVSRIMAYDRILLEGGDIRSILPLSRVLVSLGHRVGGREGQRFSVWSETWAPGPDAADSHVGEPQALYKGEIVLLEVRKSESVAEILHLGDPAWPLEAGDMLTLLPGERGLAGLSGPTGLAGGTDETHGPDDETDAADTGLSKSLHRPDPLTGLFRHGDFLAHLAEARSGCRRFGLALLHVAMNPLPADAADKYGEQARVSRVNRPDHLMASLADLCRDALVASDHESDPGFGSAAFGGRFGLNSLVFFHPEVDESSLHERYAALCTRATESLGLRVGAGLAVWPFLQFRPADMLECTRKALEYALLLPPPHVGLFDSLALNISADKRHCRGDVFGAVEEYKLALLADENNALAWNSLGVCMAGLGRHSEARRHFEEALRRTPDDPAPSYNLGAVCQTLGELDEAAARFRTCLALEPSHLYAKIRLGQLAEVAGHLDEAARCFEEAAEMREQSALPHRHLARLALRRNCPDAAREYLHQALLRNPRDAAALTLMAKLYLDGGEDPELAESLARQSVAQRADHKNGWLVLARALETQGRLIEAREARLKAGEL